MRLIQTSHLSFYLRDQLRCLCCLFLIVSLSGCDWVYRLLDKEGAEEKQLIGEIIPGQSNPTVEEAQALLYLYGYNTGRVDGQLGLRTRNAIAKFQTDTGIKQSRYLDSETWKRLNSLKETGLVLKGQLNVAMIQVLLKRAGFDPGPVDGKLGELTIKAVKSFQKARGLKVDGKIGYQTLSALASFLPAESRTK